MHSRRSFNIKSIFFTAFGIGVISTLTQIIILRECNKVFAGNEIGYALVLGFWLFWVSLGAGAGRWLVLRDEDVSVYLRYSFLLLSIVLPAVVFLGRHARSFFRLYPGELIGVLQMVEIAFAITAVLGFIAGWLFSLCCLAGKIAKNETEHARSIYNLESIGSTVAGVIFSFGLVYFFANLQLIVILALLAWGMGCLWGENKVIFLWGMCLFVGLLVYLCFERMDEQTQWLPMTLIETKSSPYGELNLVGSRGEYSLFENGLLGFTTGDVLSAEETVHYAMLWHTEPKKVLVLGSGLGGVLNEVLKYGDISVDYVELDPQSIILSQKHLPKKYTEVLKDSRVNVIYADGRNFLKRSKNKYDVVILAASDPKTLLLNRYYTKEFFREVGQALADNGVFSFSVSSSENYVNSENKYLLKSIYGALRVYFKTVHSLPGERHIFLVAKGKDIGQWSSEFFEEQIRTKGINTQFITAGYLPDRFDKARIAAVEKILFEPGQINSDERPIAFLFDMGIWASRFNNKFGVWITSLQKIYFGQVAGVLLFLFIILGILAKFNKNLIYDSTVFWAGFLSMVYQVLIILAFQSIFGYVYQMIGLIIAFFMLGLVIGSGTFKNNRVFSVENSRRNFIVIQMLWLICSGFLPFIFWGFRGTVVMPLVANILFAGLMFLAFIIGVLVGLQYVLTLVMRQSQVNVAGNLYAVDVIGAALGALTAGIFLVPVLGITQTSWLCGFLNILVILLLLRS
ncbi:MAG: hypothetical protein HQL25_01150 [Candidatus Omnitrophica bacterium]|nr:hypothetical protein [Candidatus Omnitrophota bacterium]